MGLYYLLTRLANQNIFRLRKGLLKREPGKKFVAGTDVHAVYPVGVLFDACRYDKLCKDYINLLLTSVFELAWHRLVRLSSGYLMILKLTV